MPGELAKYWKELYIATLELQGYVMDSTGIFRLNGVPYYQNPYDLRLNPHLPIETQLQLVEIIRSKAKEIINSAKGSKLEREAIRALLIADRAEGILWREEQRNQILDEILKEQEVGAL